MTIDPQSINLIFRRLAWRVEKSLETIADESLSEDLAQYSKDGLTVDYGFYGCEATREGCYCIYVILDENWEKPMGKLCFDTHVEALESLAHYAKLTRLNLTSFFDTSDACR